MGFSPSFVNPGCQAESSSFWRRTESCVVTLLIGTKPVDAGLLPVLLSTSVLQVCRYRQFLHSSSAGVYACTEPKHRGLFESDILSA